MPNFEVSAIPADWLVVLSDGELPSQRWPAYMRDWNKNG